MKARLKKIYDSALFTFKIAFIIVVGILIGCIMVLFLGVVTRSANNSLKNYFNLNSKPEMYIEDIELIYLDRGIISQNGANSPCYTSWLDKNNRFGIIIYDESLYWTAPESIIADINMIGSKYQVVSNKTYNDTKFKDLLAEE